MYFNTTSFLIIISSIFIILIEFSTIVESSKSRGKMPSCDENGKCKYGGHCDKKTNTCLCSFHCSSSLWDTSIYCGPKKPGKRAIFFKNICQVVAYACEHQEDVPIVEYVPSSKNGGRTTPRKFCKATRRRSEEVLCPRPEDFKGPCGGSSGPEGNIEAGICLMTKMTGQKSCVCPASKRGENCQEKYVNVRSIFEPETDINPSGPINDVDLDKVAVFAALSTVAFLLVVAVFIRRRRPNNEETENNIEPQQRTMDVKETCVKITTENNNLLSTKTTAVVSKPREVKYSTSNISFSRKLPGKVVAVTTNQKQEIKVKIEDNKLPKNDV